jgi:hypothetical protein
VQLPVKYSRLHDVFPVSLLEKWYSGQDQKLLPLPELVDGEEEWEVEDIVDHKNVGDERRFLVKWAGWPAEYNTWEPREHFANAKKIITAYEQKAYVGIFEGGEYCEEVRWKDPAPSAQRPAPPSGSWMRDFLFLFCCFIGSVFWEESYP